MSASSGPPSWLANHEPRYADDFEEEDSFLILPIRRDRAEVEADLANAASEIGTNARSNPSSGLSLTAPALEPESSGSGSAVRDDSSQPIASPKGSLEKPHPVPRNLPPFLVPNTGESGMDSSEQLSVISAVSTISSSDGSWEETNMLLSQLDLQSCKEKMAEMNANTKKNLEEYKAVVSKLQESLATVHEDYKKKNEECGETIRALRLENQTLKADLDNRFSDYNEQTLEKSRLHAEKDALARENSGREVEINQLKSKVEEFTIRILQTERQTVDLLGQIQNLEHLLAQQGKGDQMSSLMEERNELNEAWQASKLAIEQLKGIRTDHEEKIKMLTRMLEESNQKISRWEEFVRKKDEDIVKLKSALDEAGAKLHEFQAIIASKELEVFDAQTKIAALVSEGEKTEIYKQQMEEYKTNFEDERRDRVATRERLELANRELAQVKTELEEKTTELEKLHRIHLQFANEHVNRQPVPSSKSRVSTPAPEHKPRSLTTVASSLTQKISDVIHSVVPSQLWDEDANTASSRPSAEEFIFVNPQNSDGATGPLQPPLQPSFPEVTLGPQTPDPCPICKKKFTSFQSLERHAANCGIEAEATNTNPFVFP